MRHSRSPQHERETVDTPSLRHTCSFSNSFAFVEYEDPRDADDAFHDMHGRRYGRETFTVEVSFSSWPFSCWYLLLPVGQEHPIFVMEV
jgi:hypothetical protein